MLPGTPAPGKSAFLKFTSLTIFCVMKLPPDEILGDEAMITRLFAAFGLPKSRLGRELVLVLLIKAIVLGLAAVFIFGPNQRPRIDAAKVEAHLIDFSAAVAPKLSALKTAAPRSILP